MNDHSKNLIEIEDLHFAYGTNQVLKGIQLAVPRGKVVGILGGQASETVSEGVGDAEFDGINPITSEQHDPQCLQSSPGMIRFMNSSNSGTVNAVSP